MFIRVFFFAVISSIEHLFIDLLLAVRQTKPCFYHKQSPNLQHTIVSDSGGVRKSLAC